MSRPSRKTVPLTAWIAASVAIVATIVLIGALWFDRLFEASTAVHTPSLVQHLGSRSVLAIFAHPDDETLAAGALADAGSRTDIVVRTVTLTRGEKGQAPGGPRGEELVQLREAELRRYGSALGVDHQEIWEYPDGGLRDVASSPVIDRLVERVRTWKPDLVLTFDPAGGYNGHPDHRAAGSLATEAVRAALDSSYRTDLGASHRPKQMGYLIAPTRALSTIGGPELRAVAASQPAANVSIPVDGALRVLGWQIHASQRLDQAYPLPGWLLFDFWDKEHYRVFEPGA